MAYLVVIVKVDPPSKAFDGMAPFGSVPHHDGPAFLVVLADTELCDSLLSRNSQLLVDLVLNGKAVGVPSKASLDVVALHGPVAGDDVFDGRGEQVSIVRKAGRKWRSIVEGVVWTSL